MLYILDAAVPNTNMIENKFLSLSIIIVLLLILVASVTIILIKIKKN